MVELRKILVVDDSELIHSMYRLVLKRYKNCKILDATNGLEALDILSRENDIDLILLDINMPIMNGLQFMEKISHEKLYKNISIIVISTEGKEEDTQRALNLGAHGYATKPFKSHTLHELIEKICTAKQSSPSTEKTV